MMKLPLIFSTLAAGLGWAADLPFYIASAGGEKLETAGIHRAMLDTETGKISGLEHVVHQGGSGFLALNQDGKQLLATCSLSLKSRENGGMALYAIGENGALEKTGEISSLGRGACHVSFDTTGTVAMTANYGSGSISSAKISDDGGLTFGSFYQHEGSGAHERRQKGPHAHSIYPGPLNEYVYSADLGTDSVFVYKLDAASGKLAPVYEAKTPAGAGPRHLKFSKDGAYVYVLNELNTSISVFARQDGGALERVQDLSTLPDGHGLEGMSCSEIVVHPGGKFIYAANRDTRREGNDSISVFQLAENGELARIETVPATISIPRNITLSPEGDWLVVCGQASDELAVFAVDQATGSLTHTGENVPCPKPMCVVFR